MDRHLSWLAITRAGGKGRQAAREAGYSGSEDQIMLDSVIVRVQPKWRKNGVFLANQIHI